MLRLLLRLTLATTLTLSVASNVLLLTSATFNTAISGVMASVQRPASSASAWQRVRRV